METNRRILFPMDIYRASSAKGDILKEMLKDVKVIDPKSEYKFLVKKDNNGCRE